MISVDHAQIREQIRRDLTDVRDLDFPAGTVLVKHFRLFKQLIETRLLMRHEGGQWAGYSYEWNDSETEATLLDGGRCM